MAAGSGRNRIPVAATTSYACAGPSAVLFVVAGCYQIAALLLLILIPADLTPLAASGRWPVSRATLRMVWHDIMSVRLIIVSIAVGFLYSQFFSSIALVITEFVRRGPAQGALFALNAITVIMVQMPMTRMIGRRLGPRDGAILRHAGRPADVLHRDAAAGLAAPDQPGAVSPRSA
jgi:hypothetical protein